MHSSRLLAGLQWNIPVESYFISVFSKSKSFDWSSAIPAWSDTPLLFCVPEPPRAVGLKHAKYHKLITFKEHKETTILNYYKSNRFYQLQKLQFHRKNKKKKIFSCHRAKVHLETGQFISGAHWRIQKYWCKCIFSCLSHVISMEYYQCSTFIVN